MDDFLPPKPKAPKGKIREASDLGAMLRERCKELGLTQIELAQACKCSPRFIGELERGVAGLEAPSFDAEGEAVAAMAEHVLANAAPCIAVLRTYLG